MKGEDRVSKSSKRAERQLEGPALVAALAADIRTGSGGASDGAWGKSRCGQSAGGRAMGGGVGLAALRAEFL